MYTYMKLKLLKINSHQKNNKRFWFLSIDIFNVCNMRSNKWELISVIEYECEDRFLCCLLRKKNVHAFNYVQLIIREEVAFI